MRLASLLLPALLLSIAIAPAATHAGVLLPEDKAGSNAAQDEGSLLGLTPGESAEDTTTEKKTDDVSAPQPKQNLPATALAPSPQPQSKTTTITPGGAVAADKADTLKDKSILQSLMNGNAVKKTGPRTPFQQKVDAFYKSFHESFARDPTIIEDIPAEPYDGPDLVSALGISVSPSYVWGAQESQVIARALGIEKQEIPKRCQMRFTTKLATAGGSARFSTTVLAGAKTAMKYDQSKLQGVSFKTVALCVPPATLPRNGSLLMRSGNLLAVPTMSTAKCDVPANMGAPRYLEMTYKGDGAAACKFY